MSKEKSLTPLLLGVAAIGIALVMAAAYFVSSDMMKGLGQSTATLNQTPRRDLPPIEIVYRGPMYPNARRVEDSRDTIAIHLPSNGSFKVSSGEYVTEDGLDQAIVYYRQYFGNRAEEQLEPGGASWIEKRPDGFGVVTLKETPDKLHVKLALVVEDQD